MFAKKYTYFTPAPPLCQPKQFDTFVKMRYSVSTVMTKSQAEQFILSLTNVGRKEYLANRKDCAIYLKRLQFFLDLLGNPEKKIPHYIHVTGTSGKGSVCLMLESILRADGKKVGVLTSPHASIIQERWAVDGKLMSGKDFAEVVTEIKPKFDEYIRKSPYDMISYYETMTAIALYYFAKKKVEWAVLEVGCGGRYDATNVIPRKDVAVITNIGLDHTDLLGDTKEKIAYEKAGIIKSGCSVFTGIKEKRLLKIIKKECKKTGARFEISNSKFLISNKISPPAMLCKALRAGNIQYPISHKHQLTNAQLCFSIAKHLQIPHKTIIAGIKRVKLPLRMEIVSRKPLIILDGAHNPDKMRTTVATLKHKNIKASKQHYNITTLQQHSPHRRLLRQQRHPHYDSPAFNTPPNFGGLHPPNPKPFPQSRQPARDCRPIQTTTPNLQNRDVFGPKRRAWLVTKTK